MKQFRSPGAFAAFLALTAGEVKVAQEIALDKAAEIVETEAKAVIGEYQEPAGPFPAWPVLSDWTLEDKGAPPDDPLLREGDMRDSITHGVEGNRAVVGSMSKIALWQELGTPRAEHPIPPRSFLGRAAFTKRDTYVDAIGSRVVWAIRGLK